MSATEENESTAKFDDEEGSPIRSSEIMRKSVHSNLENVSNHSLSQKLGLSPATRKTKEADDPSN